MPVWHVLHPSTTFTTMAEKAALVRDITALYSLPAFYVNVFFHRFETGDAWDGARFQGTPPHGFDAAALGVSQRPRPFVHFEIDQIAVHITDEDWARQWCDKVIATLKPHVADKGYDYEFHIDNTPRSLWRLNGLVAPPWKSEVEHKWALENRPTPWEDEEKKTENNGSQENVVVASL